MLEIFISYFHFYTYVYDSSRIFEWIDYKGYHNKSFMINLHPSYFTYSHSSFFSVYFYKFTKDKHFKATVYWKDTRDHCLPIKHELCMIRHTFLLFHGQNTLLGQMLLEVCCNSIDIYNEGEFQTHFAALISFTYLYIPSNLKGDNFWNLSC